MTRAVDGRNNETTHEYDDRGNRLHTQHPLPGIVDDFTYNAFGQMTSHTLPANDSGYRRRDEYRYYSSGPQTGYLQAQTVDAAGLALTTGYETDRVGNVVRQVDPRGHDTLYTPNQLDQIVMQRSRPVDGGGVRYETLFWFDANDNLARVDAENRDERGELQPNSHFSTIFEYETLNQRTRTIRERGDVNLSHDILDYDGIPAPDRPQFLVTETQYDANRNPSLMVSGEAFSGEQPNNVTRTLFDERDFVFRRIRAPGDPLQSTTQTDYDWNGNVSAARAGLEDPIQPHVTSWIYDGYNRPTSVKDPMGNVSISRYDANGNVVYQRTEGELVDVEGGAGNVRLSETHYTHDRLNRLTITSVAHFDAETREPIGDGQSVTISEYAPNSQVTRVTDDNGHVTTTAYDSAGRPSLGIDAAGNAVAFVRDSNSNVTHLFELEFSDLGGFPELYVTAYAYDGLDRLTSTTNNVGSTLRFAYDSRDNRVQSVDALNHETRMAFDGLKRPLLTVRDMNGNGADPADPEDILTRQVWDANHRLRAQTDDNGNATATRFDDLDRDDLTDFADCTDSQRSHDVHGNVRTERDGNGSRISYVYDLADRVIRKDIVPGQGVSGDTTFEVFEYDGRSRLVSAVDDDSRVQRAYDSLSNVIRETQSLADAGPPATVTSEHDGVGNQVGCTYPGGRAVSRGFDELNRPTAISDQDGTIATYAYVGPARVQRRTYRNGTRTDYKYDGLFNLLDDFGVKQIVRTTHSVIAGGAVIDDRTFNWDRMGNKRQRRDVRAAGPQLTHAYDYDPAYRLRHTTVRNPGKFVVRQTDYGMDGVGNRTVVAGSPHAGTYTAQAECDPSPADFEMNQYTNTPFDDRTYDDNGNLISYVPCVVGDMNGDGLIDAFDIEPFVEALLGRFGPSCAADVNRDGRTDAFDIEPFIDLLNGMPPAQPRFAAVYDYRNRMVEQRDDDSGLRNRYFYDAFGRRAAKVVDVDGRAGGPFPTRFLLDGWRVIEEQDDSGATQATYVQGLYIDEELTMQRGGVDYYYHTDDLYNVMAVTTAVGAVDERYDYQDFGQPEFFTGAGEPLAESAIGNPLLFTGRRYDSETGWFYYRTRYLDPVAGRFTTRDTIGVWGDTAGLGNGYTYGGNRPQTELDPTGTAITCLKYSHTTGHCKGCGVACTDGTNYPMDCGADIFDWPSGYNPCAAIAVGGGGSSGGGIVGGEEFHWGVNPGHGGGGIIGGEDFRILHDFVPPPTGINPGSGGGGYVGGWEFPWGFWGGEDIHWGVNPGQSGGGIYCGEDIIWLHGAAGGGGAGVIGGMEDFPWFGGGVNPPTSRFGTASSPASGRGRDSRCEAIGPGLGSPIP